ncbi:heavy-metal-associated domain-containing protein [Sutcliffiella deserti]|uniref:heavy-metal-associated domain-containing protein n=1 Tax=Sutcliffiella deserti TaxID=2875501 RepID=UPI001CBF6E84|nr:heavy-metal-associated domain-containing protein [Sutcliffiella deserti]
MAEMTIKVEEAVKEQPINYLEKVLIQLNGMERALVDIETGEVKIEYNEHKVSKERIMKSIKENGFRLID